MQVKTSNNLKTFEMDCDFRAEVSAKMCLFARKFGNANQIGEI